MSKSTSGSSASGRTSSAPEAKAQDTIAEESRPSQQETSAQLRQVFICYRPGNAPDEKLAKAIAAGLGPLYRVYIEQEDQSPGWAGQVERELDKADLVIALLSAQSVQSEMLAAEVARAASLARKRAGQPGLVGIRLQYQGDFPYPLTTYLEDASLAHWDGVEDTAGLLGWLERLLKGERESFSESIFQGPKGTEVSTNPFSTTAAPALAPPAFSAALELPEGTMKAQSLFYITRPSDEVALETIREQGVTITIKGPRQMGKSSLLVRVAAEARKLGKRVALLDFQFFDTSSLLNAEIFLRQFCAWLSFALKVEDNSATYWQLPLGNIQRCTFYLEDYLLPELKEPLVLAMDEVDKIFDTAFRSDFFGMLRGWHNLRYSSEEWQKLDLVLVTSTEPYQLVSNLNQSPFNVGQVIELEDFTPAQLHELNLRHGSPFSPDQEKRLMELLGGQPYLVRRALYLVATRRLSISELFNSASAERGPFGDHLRYHLFRMHHNSKLVKGLWQVIQQRSLNDEDIFFRLHGAGLIRREGRSVTPRCQLYADYFREHLSALIGQAEETATPQANPPSHEVPVLASACKEAGTGQNGLSSRELEVLRLVVAGLNNTQISQTLSISPGTVNVHLSTIYSKLGVSSRTAAMRFALDKGLV